MASGETTEMTSIRSYVEKPGKLAELRADISSGRVKAEDILFPMDHA